MSVLSYGYVLVAAAGTPARLTANAAVPGDRVGAQSVMVQALPGNAGLVYVGLGGMNKTTGVNVLAILPKPASATTGPFPSVTFSEPTIPAGFNLADLYIDAGTNNDGVVVSITRG